MVKAMIGIIVLAGIGLTVLYYAGGFASHDPTVRGREARAAVAVGQTWKQGLDAAGEPGKYRTMLKVKKRIQGEEVEIIEPGAEMRFDRALFEKDFNNTQFTDGFVFVYFFSYQVAFELYFDGAGNVTAIDDTVTAADVLGTRK